MADGGGAKQFVQEVAQATGEVVKDFGKELGQMASEAGQSLTGQPLTPQQIQQQQQQDQVKLAEARRKIKWHKDVAEAQKRVREQQKQQLIQQQQAEQAEKTQPSEKPGIAQKPAPQGKVIREDIAETMSELKGGRGKGG